MTIQIREMSWFISSVCFFFFFDIDFLLILFQSTCSPLIDTDCLRTYYTTSASSMSDILDILSQRHSSGAIVRFKFFHARRGDPITCTISS